MKLVPAFVLFVLVSVLVAKDKPDEPAKGEVLALEPFKVRGTAVGNFAIDIRIYVSSPSKKSIKIFITRVPEESDAAAVGLKAGDEIIKIDGIPVEGMDPRISRDSQLGRIFLNRGPNDPLNLEIVTHSTRDVTLHAVPVLGIR